MELLRLQTMPVAAGSGPRVETTIGPLQVGSHVEVKWVGGEGADQQFYDAVVTAVRSYAGAPPRLGVDICHLPLRLRLLLFFKIDMRLLNALCSSAARESSNPPIQPKARDGPVFRTVTPTGHVVGVCQGPCHT
eukprot:COSAG04_NODE_10772_length_754_cov_1.114504_1_plen_133_part_10